MGHSLPLDPALKGLLVVLVMAPAKRTLPALTKSRSS